MVQDPNISTPPALEPDAVFMRRKKLLEAIDYELDLERDVLEKLQTDETTLQDNIEALGLRIIGVDKIDEIQERIDEISSNVADQELNVTSLEDAYTNVLNSLSAKQIQEFHELQTAT